MKNILLLVISIFIFTSGIFCQNLTVKDASSNNLLQINDEGNFCSILIPPATSYLINPDQKLYNYKGKLMWDGLELGSSFTAAGWTYDGANILTNTLNDRVGIGMTSAPSVKLSLGADISPKKLALFDLPGDFYGFGVDWGRITIYTNNTEKMTIEDNGNVGIGTTNPDAKLDVNGDMRVGSSGVKFSEIYELTGTTGGIGSYMIIVPYPTGYNQANTRGLSLSIQVAPGYWWSMGYYDSYTNISIHYILGNEGIVIHYPVSGFDSRPFRMVLMKVE